MKTPRLARLTTLAASVALVLVSLVPIAVLADSYATPVIYVADAPFTRNVTVKLAVIQSDDKAITEYRISNQAPSPGGNIVSNYTSIGERLDWYMPVTDPRFHPMDWTLPNADGAHTVYAQVFYQGTQSWSNVVSLDLKLARSGHTSLYIDSDAAGLWSTTDFHTWAATSAPSLTPIYAVTSQSSRGTTISIRDGVWSADFIYSGTITSGNYSVANNPTSCTTACVAVSHFEAGNSGTCTATSGSFDIGQISFDNGDVSTETADFVVQCGSYKMAGSIRYGSAIGSIALDQDVDSVDFGVVNVGSTSAGQTITFTNFGDLNALLGVVAFTGTGAGDYSTSSDTCSNTSINVGSSCHVTVRVSPSLGWKRSFLSLPDGTARGARSVALETTGEVVTTISLAAKVVPVDPGPASFVVTVTPPPPCEPQLYIDGVEQIGGVTSEAKTNPSRTEYTFAIANLSEGKHTVVAQYEECGYYLASGPVNTTVTVGSDDVAPTGSIEINDGDAYTNNTHVYLILAATDDKSAMGQVALSDDGQTWGYYPYALHLGYDLYPTTGTHTVYAKFSDAFDNWSPVYSATISYDTNPPVVDPPSEAFVQGSTISGGAVTVDVPIDASDNLSGVASLNLSQKTNAGAWKSIVVPPGASAIQNTVDRQLTPGNKYTFRARATDTATNTSAWALGNQINLKKMQDTSTRITYSSGWKSVSNTSYWGGAAKKATAAGSTTRIAFTGTAFAWVARVGPDRGKAQISVDGHTYNVDLYSPTVGYKRLAWTHSWSTRSTHTVIIKVTSSGKIVELDALLTAE